MYFDLKALQSFHLYWRSLKFTEMIGRPSDMEFLSEGDWLQDSAVLDRIEPYRGQWSVSLVFADTHRQSTFIIKAIRTCPSYDKAVVTANHMRRLAAKDPRGTQVVDASTFNLNFN